MNSRLFLQSQTELLDLWLAELSQLSYQEVVNFNNTAQFDVLLRHLELSFLAPSFCQVPSPYVLHVLVTLASRCPESNWSHHPSLGAVESSTEYMRRVNNDYDSALDKLALLQRSLALLLKYVALMSTEPLSAALKTLFDNMHSVVLHLVPEPPRSINGDPKRSSPQKASPRKMRSHVKLQAMAEAKGTETDVPLNLHAVEVISDSEDSDGPLELVSHVDPVSGYRPVISLSELGANTSGLGEVASLFKDMPHLSAHPTPEPEAPVKKHKSDFHLWRRIQVYDDAVLAARISADYTFWDLVRWMFWCADSSSQYQKFLFNSNNTCVHSCYVCYASVVKVVVGCCTAQLQCLRASPLMAGLYLQSHDKTVEIVFLGLGNGFRNKPFPCYNRELILLAHDPSVLVSQCKKSLDYDDNMESMGLRVEMLALFSFYERHHDKRRPDIRSLVLRKAKTDRILALAQDKVCGLSVQHTKAFFGVLLTPGFLRDYTELFMANLAMAVLCKTAEIEMCMYDSLKGKFVNDVISMVSSRKLYCGITEDLSLPDLESFLEQWTKTVVLAEWVFWRAVSQSEQDVSASARVADETLQSCVRKFLESRCGDADIIEDSAFTVARHEVDEALGRAKCRFLRIARQKF